jgi:5-methylcytosine-specific restriction endonuclease McrA
MKLIVPDSEKHAIKLGLRYEVLKRDRFRCIVCGRSPATTMGIELHVDHEIPFSAGGKTVAENLRSTCSECNLGKGARREEH